MDGTETKQGDVKTSATEQGTSKETQTFTQEQVDKQISDRLAQAGREVKTVEKMRADIEKRENAIRETEERLQQEQEERELRELEGVAQENPEEKPTLEAYRKKLANQRRELNTKIAQYKPILDAIEALGITDGVSLTQRIKNAEEAEFEITIFDIANEHKVDAGILKDKAEKLKLKDEASINEIAAVMPKKAETEPTDSGKTAGGIDLSNMTPDEELKEGFKRLKK